LPIGSQSPLNGEPFFTNKENQVSCPFAWVVTVSIPSERGTLLHEPLKYHPNHLQVKPVSQSPLNGEPFFTSSPFNGEDSRSFVSIPSERGTLLHAIIVAAVIVGVLLSVSIPSERGTLLHPQGSRPQKEVGP